MDIMQSYKSQTGSSTLQFHLCKVQKQTSYICVIQVNDSVYFGVRSNQQECHPWGFWNSGNVLSLDIGGSYMGEFIESFIQMYILYMCTLLYIRRASVKRILLRPHPSRLNYFFSSRVNLITSTSIHTDIHLILILTQIQLIASYFEHNSLKCVLLPDYIFLMYSCM